MTSNGTNGLCSTGGSFVLMGDQLYEDGMMIATNISSGYMPLLLMGNGSISDGFAVDGSGTLTWSNPGFTNGQASFYISSVNSLVYVIFSGSGPASCNILSLSTLPGASCPDFEPVYPSGGPGTVWNSVWEALPDGTVRSKRSERTSRYAVN